jgi:hypothetical protein
MRSFLLRPFFFFFCFALLISWGKADVSTFAGELLQDSFFRVTTPWHYIEVAPVPFVSA